eukprot:782372-Prymnesium_polylepis.1
MVDPPSTTTSTLLLKDTRTATHSGCSARSASSCLSTACCMHCRRVRLLPGTGSPMLPDVSTTKMTIGTMGSTGSSLASDTVAAGAEST